MYSEFIKCISSLITYILFVTQISPGASAADHSINTLRYADRTKVKGGLKGKSPVRVRSPVPGKISSEIAERSTCNSNATTDSSIMNSDVTRNGVDPVPSSKEEEALRQAETILSTHIRNIQENAELLSLEGALLAEARLPSRTSEDIERYLTALEEILDHKEDMILNLRRQMVAFQELKP